MCTIDRSFDYNFQAQNLGDPVSFTQEDPQTRVPLSEELIIGAYAAFHPVYELGPCNWKMFVLSLLHSPGYSDLPYYVFSDNLLKDRSFLICNCLYGFNCGHFLVQPFVSVLTWFGHILVPFVRCVPQAVPSHVWTPSKTADGSVHLKWALKNNKTDSYSRPHCNEYI